MAFHLSWSKNQSPCTGLLINPWSLFPSSSPLLIPFQFPCSSSQTCQTLSYFKDFALHLPSAGVHLPHIYIWLISLFITFRFLQKCYFLSNTDWGASYVNITNYIIALHLVWRVNLKQVSLLADLRSLICIRTTLLSLRFADHWPWGLKDQNFPGHRIQQVSLELPQILD